MTSNFVYATCFALSFIFLITFLFCCCNSSCSHKYLRAFLHLFCRRDRGQLLKHELRSCCCLQEDPEMARYIYLYDAKRVPYASSSNSSTVCCFNYIRTSNQILNKECVICLEEFCEDEDVIMLSCFHSFHEVCIAKWLKNKTKSSCPLCKKDLHTNFVAMDTALWIHDQGHVDVNWFMPPASRQYGAFGFPINLTAEHISHL